MQKRVNVQIGGWKHICHISCDTVNTDVYADVSPTTDICGLTRRPKVVLFPVCNLYFFYILLQPCFERCLYRHLQTELA